MIVRNVPQMSFIAAPRVLGSKEATTIVTRGEFHREYAQHIGPQLTPKEQKLISELGVSSLSDVATRIQKLQQSSYSAVSWKATNQLPNDAGDLYASKILDPNEYVLVALASLVKADQKPQQVALPSEPTSPRDLASRKTQLSKGEFESTAQFSTRQAAADARAQSEFDQDQRAFEASKRDYAAAVKQQADAQARALADSNNPEIYKALAAKHLPQAVALALGNPVLSDITYDADKQVFNATLKSSRGAFSQPVTMAASLADAPKLKQDLLSQKIAPVVTLQLPSLTATLVLQENEALRSASFAQANNSARKLLELIAEYPSSAEARAAKQRIPAAQREAYDAAVRSNSSSGYQSFIGDFAGADTQKLLPQAEKAKQVAAQREERERQAKVAQERREQADREEQYRRDAPARQARQMCEAQKQSCLASCGDRIGAFTSRGIASGEYARIGKCETSCHSIGCN